MHGTPGTLANHGCLRLGGGDHTPGVLEHLLAAPVTQGAVVGEPVEDVVHVGCAEQAGTGLDDLLPHLPDDLAPHGVELVGREAHGGVLSGQGAVHRLAVRQVADARMVVVAGRGEDRGAQHVPVGRQGRAGMPVDGDDHRLGEGVVGVGPGQRAGRGILDHEVELGDGGLDQPGHRRPSRPGALGVTLRHRGEHARQAAQAGRGSRPSAPRCRAGPWGGR